MRELLKSLMNKKQVLSAYILLTMSALFWAGNFVVGRIVHTEFPPFTLAFFRWLLVIIILLPMLYTDLMESLPEIRKHIISLLILSILCITINSSFVYLGLNFTTVLNTSLIYATVPVLITLMSFFLLGDSLSQCEIFGALISFLGAIFILLGGDPRTIFKIHYQFGDFFILIAAVSWALFSVIYKKVAIQMSPLLFLLVIALLGDILLLPCVFVEKYMGHNVHYSLLSIGGVLYASIFSSLLAMTCWNIGVSVVGASIAANFFNLLPFFGSILSVLFLGESIRMYHLFGGFFVLLGVFLAVGEERIKFVFSRKKILRSA